MRYDEAGGGTYSWWSGYTRQELDRIGFAPFYRFTSGLDARWVHLNVRICGRDDEGYVRHPRLWAFTTVPLSTWLRHPADGWESYQRHRPDRQDDWDD